MRAILGDLAC